MPYILQNRRYWLDKQIAKVIKEIMDDTRDGELNYTISTLINNLYDRNYKELNAAIGVLECVKQELYRQVIAPYEDLKIRENGDVYSSRSS